MHSGPLIQFQSHFVVLVAVIHHETDVGLVELARIRCTERDLRGKQDVIADKQQANEWPAAHRAVSSMVFHVQKNLRVRN